MLLHHSSHHRTRVVSLHILEKQNYSAIRKHRIGGLQRGGSAHEMARRPVEAGQSAGTERREDILQNYERVLHALRTAMAPDWLHIDFITDFIA